MEQETAPQAKSHRRQCCFDDVTASFSEMLQSTSLQMISDSTQNSEGLVSSTTSQSGSDSVGWGGTTPDEGLCLDGIVIVGGTPLGASVGNSISLATPVCRLFSLSMKQSIPEIT
jgi:hypothetical protein